MRIMSFISNLNKADKIFLLVWVITVLIQFHYFRQVQVHLSENSVGLVGFTTETDYGNLSKNLFHHNVYKNGEYPNLVAEKKRPPFYPFMLSMWYRLFGDDQFSGIVFNNVLLSLTIIFVFLMGRLINSSVGIISAIIIICDPMTIQRANSIQSEVPFMFVFTISIFLLLLYFVVRPKLTYAIAFSFVFFLSTFTRAVTLYFPYLIPIIFLIFAISLKDGYKKHLNFILIFFLVNSTLSGLWMYRNYTVSGLSYFTGMKDIHAYNYLAVVSTGAKKYHSGQVSRKELKKALDTKYLDNDNYRGLSGVDKYHYRISVAKKVIIDNWKGFTYHFFYGFGNFFVGYSGSLYWLNYPPEKYAKRQEFSQIKDQGDRLKSLWNKGYWDYLLYSAVTIGFLYMNVIFTIGGFYNFLFVNQDKRKKRFGIFIFILFCYIVFMSCTWGISRFRLQINPIMALTSSYFLCSLISRLKISRAIFKRN